MRHSVHGSHPSSCLAASAASLAVQAGSATPATGAHVRTEPAFHWCAVHHPTAPSAMQWLKLAGVCLCGEEEAGCSPEGVAATTCFETSSFHAHVCVTPLLAVGPWRILHTMRGGTHQLQPTSLRRRPALLSECAALSCNVILCVRDSCTAANAGLNAGPLLSQRLCSAFSLPLFLLSY